MFDFQTTIDYKGFSASSECLLSLVSNALKISFCFSVYYRHSECLSDTAAVEDNLLGM